MKKICVGVTGLGVSDRPMSGLGIAKSLRLNKDIRLIGLTYDTISSGCYSGDVFDEIHLVGNPLQDVQKFFEDIVRLKEKHGLQVLIPSVQWEIPVCSTLKDKIKRKKIDILIPESNNLANVFDPRVAYFASSRYMRIPAYTFIHDRRGLTGKLSSLRFPIIIRDIAENYVAYDTAEAEVFALSHFRYGDSPLCIQEYVNGEEYSVAALADRNSKLTGIVIVKKLVMTGQGIPWIVVSVWDKELVTFTEKLIQHLNWVGPLELRFIKEIFTNHYTFIKFEPCFPSWVYFATRVGQNLPLKAVKLAMGKTVKASTAYNPGYMYVRSAEDIICDIHVLFALTASRRLIYRG
ncbi:MAG TPA: hypothetical protein ACFYD2_09315 [Candidatus Avalokitesvara rifleensis]|uniref:hypothetical protein n=1 Tax=Candidatus Avalokitesvara rifleensis TaxID=3367620 RepID=UPI0027122D97|nr:hypothetical protein [Candidatus Brocadiales bacterium]